jgi:drug/metabolite transporter (DMT)-like permease
VLTVLLGLCGALAYGVSDFLGGLASRRTAPIIVAGIAGAVGILPLLIAVPILGARFTADALLWGVLAGLSGSVGVLLLYAALAIGPMSVLSPVTSVFAALLPVGVAVLTGTRLEPLTIGAVAMAIVAVVLVASTKNTTGARVTGRGLLIAVISGCGFGGLVLAYNGTAPADGIAPLVIARIVLTAVMGVGIAIVVGPSMTRNRGFSATLLPRGRRFWLAVVACGVIDASANIFIQAGLHAGDPAALPIVSVLNALYPIGTILLAAVVLRERLTWVQVGGLALGFAASAVLALT